MTQKLPLFPLNTVLFPGAPLQLHIFEDRYRLMIGRCLEQRSPFGVVLLRTGGEVSADDPWVRRQVEQAGGGDAELNLIRQQLGGDAQPYSVGTTAQISAGESVRFDDGRYYLVAQGQRRFRIQYVVQRQPYLVASVAYLPEESHAASAAAAGQLRELYARYCQAISSRLGGDSPAETPPDGAVEITYWLAHRLQVDNQVKQRWLEADIATRLREMAAALRNALAMLPHGSRRERERGGDELWN